MRIDVVTIFPEYLEPARLSLLGKAQESGLVTLAVHDLRSFTSDRHRTVDDTPYGGGPGMVMLAEPWGAALASLSSGDAATRPVLVVPTPSGRPFTQTMAAELATAERLVFACGRYEGIDARVLADALTAFDVVELSIGDYVLAGGEVAALVIIEAVSRLIPGVLGNESSVVDDSFAPGAMEHLLEGPVFSKPASWNGHDVPSVLLSGDHGAIARWRRDESLRRTALVRPDLIEGRPEGAFQDSDRSVLEARGWSVIEGRWQRPPLAVSD